MKNNNESLGNQILSFLFKNKLRGSITFVVYLLIYKIIDMNTLQWFGKDIFIKNGANLIEFLVSALGLGSFVVVGLAIIVNLFRGKLF